MTKNEVKKLIREVSKSFGYQSKGKWLYRMGPELATFVDTGLKTHFDVASSTYGGWHVNFHVGVDLTIFSKIRMPKYFGDNGIEFATLHMDWEMKPFFWKLRFENGEQFSRQDLEAAFRKLFIWVEEHLAHADNLRAAILRGEEFTETSVHQDPRVEDWAKGRLKDPAEYRGFGPKPKRASSDAAIDCSPCSFHFKTTDLAAVRDAAKKIIPRSGGTLAIAPPARGWVSAFPSDDIFDHRLAKRIAVKAGIAHALVLSVHDKDIACYWYYCDGKLADYFNSCPDYFDAATRTDMRAKGNPAAFEGLLTAAAQKRLARLTASRLIGEEGTEWVGDGPRFDIEDERIIKIAKVFGIKYLTEHSLDENGELIEIE